MKKLIEAEEGLYIEKKSKFICHLFKVSDPDEAQELLKGEKKRYFDAKHHCYAYIIGTNSGIMRYSDDGEPGGTAGMPIMAVLKNRKIVNCCVVIVRYFGGVLLGTGGLVRAYTEGCKIALQASDVVTMELSVALECVVSYSDWNLLQYALQKMPVALDNISYQETVRFTLCARQKNIEEVISSINRISEGKARWSEPEEKYVPWPD